MKEQKKIEQTLCKMINQLLCDLTVASRNVHIVHWNLLDETFISMHPYLGEVYETLSLTIDETAEQIRFKGYFANATLSACLKKTMLTEIESTSSILFEEGVKTVIANLKYLKTLTDDIITYADKHEIWDSVDTFTKHTVNYAKILYFLENSISKR